MAAPDRAYANLLAHLHNPNTDLPLSTIQSALAHYLAHLTPRPTPLAATAVSSPLYLVQPFTHERLQSLLTAFRHATHIKYRALIEDFKRRSRLENIFTKSLNAALVQWLEDVVKGIQGGHPVLNLSCLSGMLLGIHDLELETKTRASRPIELGSAKNDVEGEMIVAVAEVMDTYSYGFPAGSPGEWEKELQPNGRETLTLALVVASQSLPLVSGTRFSVLPLPTLVQLVVATISSAFHSGKFLHGLSSSVNPPGEYRVHIPPDSPVTKTLQTISASPITSSLASLSRLAACSQRSLLESYSYARVADGLRTASETLQILRDITSQAEQDWIAGTLADIPEDDIAPESRPITKMIWTTLKTMLFSTIMLSDAILSSIVYIPPRSAPYSNTSITSSFLALQVLHILSHLAFIISQFGGVASTSTGFEQLKKTFYLALDILAQADDGNGTPADIYVKEQCLGLKSSAITGAPGLIQSAKKTLVLASIEQLVPVLSEECIRTYVLDVCYPCLSDSSHREIYESAHSVILAILVSHAQKQQQRQLVFPVDPGPSEQSTTYQHDCQESDTGGMAAQKDVIVRPSSTLAPDDFAKKIVPFYAHCLIENSAKHRLSTPQLRLAYSALVRCAGASGLDLDTPPEEALTLAWYCVEFLLGAIRLETPQSQSHQSNHREEVKPQKDMERLHRLHLTLISTVPSLPLLLMLRVLEEIKIIISNYPPSTRGADLGKAGEEGTREQLVKALFTEILERVGYRERNSAMQWWYQNREEFQGPPSQDRDALSPPY